MAKKKSKKKAKRKPKKKVKAKRKPAKKKRAAKPAKEKKLSARDKLNLKHQKFCELFTTDREFLGNGVEAYAEVYDIDLGKKKEYLSAKSSASRLLTNVDLLAYINELLEELALNEPHVDKQLAFLITQNADFKAKIAAIREYNALKQRITKKFEHTGADGEPIPVNIVHFKKKKK